MKKSAKFATAIIICASFVGLTACSKGESYAVHVSAAEHGKVFALQTAAKSGEKVRLSCMPEAGYKLAGFTLNGEKLDGNTFIMPNGDVQVSAVFEPVTYSITYVGGDPSGNPTAYTVNDWGTTLIQPDKGDYDVGGWYYHFTENEWYLDGLEDYAAATIAEGTIGNLTLYAHRYNVPHEITTDETEEHFSVWADRYEAAAGEEVHLEYYIYDENYAFECFTVDGKAIDGDSFIMGHEPVEISAKVNPVDYMIVYETDGGIFTESNPATYNAESGTLKLAPPTKDGYEFAGWECVDGEGGIYRDFSLDVCGDYDGYVYIDVREIIEYKNVILNAWYVES